MAQIQHAAIADPYIHEPKGVASATASYVYAADGTGSGDWVKSLPNGAATAQAGAVFRSNGAGDGTWLRAQGWGQYQDTARTVGSPTQTLTAGARTLFICDGGFLTAEHLPQDATVPLWDISTNKQIPIAVDDVYHVRVSFAVENYSGATPYIDFELDIGGGIGEIYWDSVSLRKGGSQQRLSFSFPVFAGSTYNTNGGSFYLTYEGSSTCDIYANDIFIIRESKAYV